jgi:hypothetical protein
MTIALEGVDTPTPRARVRVIRADAPAHDHAKTGIRVRGSSGVQYQWCAECGALGMCKPDGADPVWIVPGADAEDMAMDVMAAIR